MSPVTQRLNDPMRASTGTMQLSAPYNEPSHEPLPPLEPPVAHPGYNGYPPEAVYPSAYDPRMARSPPLEAHPVSSTTFRSPDQTNKSRTDYTVRRRHRSNTASAADGRHPLRVTVSPTTSSRPSPIVTPSYGHPVNPWPADSDRYLAPASPHLAHRRVYNVDPDGNSRLVRTHRNPREYPIEPSQQYSGGYRKGEDIDDYDAYSYTNPREQFEKDSVDRVGRRRGVYRRERPSSVTGAEELYPQYAPKRESRAHGPPPSQRGFDKLDKLEKMDQERARRLNYGSAESDRETMGSRQSWQRDPNMYQDWDNGYYSPYRESYYDDSHLQHRRRRHHDDPERRSRKHRLANSINDPIGSGAGLGTAGLASGYDDFDYNYSPERDWADYPTERGHGHRRRRSRSKGASRRRSGTDPKVYMSDEDLRDHQREPPARHRDSGSNSSQESSPHRLAIEAPRRRGTSRSRTRADSYSGRETGRHGSGSSQEETKKQDPEPQPKSILKPPRDKFPEEPNPVREGVAPLKDAHKKGIPPGARWTKVDRRLVNPAALEAGHERFEERAEYVIVLRVLAKEEIQAYAVLTQELRGISPAHLGV